jgi:hypothetical protein
MSPVAAKKLESVWNLKPTTSTSQLYLLLPILGSVHGFLFLLFLFFKI